MGQESSRPQEYKMTEHDKAMLQLKKSRDNIDKYSQSMFRKIGIERRQVKSIVRKRNGAKLLPFEEMKCKSILKRIRYQESLVNKAVQQLMSLEEMILNLDFKHIEMSFIQGLENGNNILKQLNEELTLEKVDAVLDESEEQMALANEINDVLGEQATSTGEYLENEVDLELQEMIEEFYGVEEVKKPVEIGKLPSLSHLPELEARKEEEERVLIPS